MRQAHVPDISAQRGRSLWSPVGASARSIAFGAYISKPSSRLFYLRVGSQRDSALSSSNIGRGFIFVGYGTQFFSPKGEWGRERRKGKIIGSTNDVAKEIINVVSFVVDEPVLSSLGGHTGEKVIASGNYNVTQERNVVQRSTSISSTVDLNEVNVPLIKASVIPINVPLIALTRNGANVAISLEYVRAISKCFADTVCGFFSGKQMVYLLVDIYVQNTCNKYGLVKQMSNSSNGFFYSSLSLRMEWIQCLRMVFVWVKFHGVPMTALSEDGLSVIAIKLGPPLCVCNHGVGSSSTTPIVEKIDQLERKILERKLMFLDDDGKPLYKADFTSIADSDSEVKEVFN
ncbi:hypothetical protein Tco_1438541 [Tanacetum coccineum]